MGWEALGQWGEDVARIEPLAGGSTNDVWNVRVHGHLAVGRLGARSDADLGWETELLQHLDREGLTVPVPIPTTDGRLFPGSATVLKKSNGRPYGLRRRRDNSHPRPIAQVGTPGVPDAVVPSPCDGRAPCVAKPNKATVSAALRLSCDSNAIKSHFVMISNRNHSTVAATSYSLAVGAPVRCFINWARP